MAYLIFNLQTPDGKAVEASLPDDEKVKDLISELINQLKMPKLHCDGQLMAYYLQSRLQGKMLSEERKPLPNKACLRRTPYEYQYG